MKKHCLASILVIGLCHFAVAQNKQPAKPQKQTPPPSKVDTYFGFRDMRLNSDVSLHPDMRRIGSDSISKKQIYTRPSDELRVGEATLKSIDYVYYAGKLQSILLSVSGSLDTRLLIEALTVKYGKPSHRESSYEQTPYLWEGRLATIYCGAPDSDDDVSVLIICKALQAKEKADAANDL